MTYNTIFSPAEILLPKADTAADWQKWAVIACDQFTSQMDYWNDCVSLIGGGKSTYDYILPEAYLGTEKEASHGAEIAENMAAFDPASMNTFCGIVYLERTLPDGSVRHGMVGKMDLEAYSYAKDSRSPIRATEATILERIPPRQKIRAAATVELPHILVLISDKPEDGIFASLDSVKGTLPVLYDFDLMLGGGHVKGKFISGIGFAAINRALAELATPEMMQAKYGVETSPLLFAIGDGNHSLASAKALYEEIKGEIGAEAAASHPARYALCEIVNLHDEALDFEPIYRVLFGVEPEAFVAELSAHLATLSGTAAPQTFTLAAGEARWNLRAETPVSQLAVGTVQAFLDDYVAAHPGVTVDYIHGEDTACQLAERENTVAILFDGMAKNMLFKTVICDGALPRKTFSMGHAQDKRYYVECRKIR